VVEWPAEGDVSVVEQADSPYLAAESEATQAFEAAIQAVEDGIAGEVLECIQREFEN